MAPIRLVLAVVAVAALAVACSDDDSTTEGRQDPAAAAAADLDAQAAARATTLMSTGRPRTRPRRPEHHHDHHPRHCRQQIRAHDRRLFRPARGSRRRPATGSHHQDPLRRAPRRPDLQPTLLSGRAGRLYPGDDIVEDYALAACYLRFEAWADAIYETSALEIRAFTPTATTSRRRATEESSAS